MALTKPILNTIGSFDVHVGFKFTFQVIGGDKVTGCRLTVFNNTTNAQVYQAEQTHESYDFTLPADASGITNKTSGSGGNYNAYIQTTDGAGNWSEPSSRMQFYCFVTPVFEFTVDTTTVVSATNTWYLTYAVNPEYPTENIDVLATYGFTLYNSDGSQAQTSGTLFTSSRPDLNYTFNGLLNGSTYKVQAFGITNNQMQVLTVLDEFLVAYTLVPPAGVISATNFCDEGYVVVQVDISALPDLENYQYARLYRKDANTNEDWLLLIENYATNLSSGVYVYTDKYNRHGVTYEYALALVLFSGVESGYTTTQVYSEFDGVFLLDLNTIYKIYSGAEYGDTTSVQKVGVHEPIGSQYPIVVHNATTDYQKGSVNATVLDINYDTTREINRFGVTQRMGILDRFLKNKLAKILKDWNGNIWLCSIIGDPTISYDNNFGMGFIKCMFEWIEQGKYNNHDALSNSGLLPKIKPVSVKFTGLEGTTISLTNSNGDLLNAIIGSSGETIVTTYVIGAYSGTATLTNEFGTQYTTISANILTDIVNVVNIPHYHLTVNGEASVYSATSKIHLESAGSTLEAILDDEVVFPIIQLGTWSGYALAYTSQKQYVNIVVGAVDNTLTIQTAITLTVVCPSDISYSLSNTNGGFTNLIGGVGDSTLKLFTSGTWNGTAIASGSQSNAISVTGVAYGVPQTFNMPHTALTLSATGRLATQSPCVLSMSNGGAISKTFAFDNGAWGTSTGANSDIQYVYGNGYWVSYSQGLVGIKYSSGNPPSSWTSLSITTDTITSVAYGNGYWVAVTSTGEVWYRASTPNGTWTLGADLITGTYDPINNGDESAGVLTSVAYANGYWVILKESPYYPAFLAVFYRASTPVGAWTRQNITTDGYTGYRRYANLIYADGYWVFACIGSSNVSGIHGYCYKASTPNGIWTYRALSVSGISIPTVSKIRYGNGYWVILDITGAGLFYTNGGLNGTWTGDLYESQGDAFEGFLNMKDIIYANDYWIITFQTVNSEWGFFDTGVLYKYGNPLGIPMASDVSIDWMMQFVTGVGNVNGTGSAWGNRWFNVSFGEGSPNYLILSSETNPRYHTFPNPQTSAKTQYYSLIKSGTWTGSGSIDNHREDFSTVVPNPPSGSVTLAVKDRDLT